jgi:GNAT superfamily N-acetyltransferase
MKEPWVVKRIPSNTPERHTALRLAVSNKSAACSLTYFDPVEDLLASASRGEVKLDLLFGAFCGDQLVGAALAVESPGRAALVFIPQEFDGDLERRATVDALSALQPAAWERGLKLLEALTEPSSPYAAEMLPSSGFRHLTQLLYLRRTLENWDDTLNFGQNLDWVTYEPEIQSTFEHALTLSYVQSLDCPEITGLRSTAEVLAGHRTEGSFDPALWSVAFYDGEPAGILLMSEIHGGRLLEIVYMGVAQTARGTGVANALLSRAVCTARARNASALALAVDVRNTPARRLYDRWRFRLVAAREAWIASPPAARV